MSWKHLSIFKKIGLGPGMVLIFLAIISLQSFIGVTNILGDSREVIFGNRLDGVMVQKEVDHLNWANSISRLLKGEDPSTLKIMTDHTQCSLGKWLYGDERKKAEQTVPELAPLFKAVELSHQQMHESAEKIKQTFKPDHRGLDLVLSKLLTDHVKWVAGLGKALAEETGGIYTYQSRLKTSTQQALSLIEEIDRRTDLTLPQRKALAYKNLKTLRYGEKKEGYFFVIDTDATILMQPFKPGMEGKNFKEAADVHGNLFFNQMAQTGKTKGSGFVTYYWHLPQSKKIAPKISYVQIYEPWNWVIGTGIYVDHTNTRLVDRVKTFSTGVPFSSGLESDHTKCGLGRFLSSEEILKLAETFPELKKTLDGIVEPHQELHRLALDIEDAVNRMDIHAATKLFQNDVQANLAEIDSLLSLTIEAEKILKGNKVAAEAIFTEETLPKLQQVGQALNNIRSTARKHLLTDDAIADRADSLRARVAIFSFIALILSIGLTFFIASSITRPLKRSIDFAKTVASGDLTQTMEMDQKDEVGELCQTMNQMSGNLNKMFVGVTQSVQTLTSSATELSAVSEQITMNTSQTAEKSAIVSDSSEKMNANMQTVAVASEQTTANIQMIVAAVEEMSSTINEISNTTSRGSQTTAKAVENARQVSSKVDDLGQAAAEISKVTATITDISEQTNLLALNATIEAARAGEAGKGFAVVAGEIKALAQKTAEATQEISSRINGVQATTGESIQAIESIVNVINDIDAIVSSVASAMEEQSSGTREISLNVNQAASGLEEVNQNVGQTSVIADAVTKDISSVSQATEEMSIGSSQIKSSAAELSRMAENLNEMVRQFKI